MENKFAILSFYAFRYVRGKRNSLYSSAYGIVFKDIFYDE